MSCNISQNDLLAYVSGYIADIKKKGEPFVLKDVISRINTDLKDVFTDPAERLAHLRLVPEMIKDTMLDSEFYDYFTDADLDHKALNTLIKGFNRDIKNVGVYLGETAEPIAIIEKAIETNKNRINQLPLPTQTAPTTASLHVRTDDEDDKLERRRPLPTSTTSQSALGATFQEKQKNILDERVVPYDTFQKELVKEIIAQGVYGNELILTGSKTVKGVYVTAVMGSAIPKDKRRTRDQERLASGELSEETFNNTAIFVITDSQGEFLYFNDDNKITNNKGRLMLFDMRSAKSKLQIISRAALNLGKTIPETEALVTQGLKNNEAVRAYLNKNPKARIRSNPIGGTDGYVPLDRHKPHPLTLVDFKGLTPIFGIDKTSTSKRKPVYMKLQGIEVPINLNVLSVSSEDASMISDFLTSDVYQKKPGGKEELVTMAKKLEYLQPIIYSEELTRLANYATFPNGKEEIYKRLTSVYNGNTQVEKYRGKTEAELAASEERVWNLNDPDIAMAPVIAPVRGIANGVKGVYWLQRVTYNVSDISLSKGVYDKVEIKPRKGGGFNLTTDFTAPSNYHDWIFNHTTTTAKLNAINQVVSMNPSIDYEWIQEDLDKINNVKAEVAKAIENIKSTSPAPSVAPVDQIKKTVSPTEVLKKLKDSGEYNKRKYQKESNVKATLEQLEEAKVWWNKHPLSKHISFEAMFNIINTANPDSVAHWTTQGIVLFKGSDYSDLYHEAWHGFTQTFLTKEQKARLYGEARKLQGSFLDFQGKRVAFSKASELQLEEYMAEAFREFMLSGGKPLDNVVINSIFQKILNFLKALFGKLTAKDVILDPNSTYMRELFDKLRVGDLNAFTFDMNNSSFAVLNKGYQQITTDKERSPELTLSITRPINDSLNYLVSDVVNQMNSGIESDVVWEKVKKANNQLLPNLTSEEFEKFREEDAALEGRPLEPLSTREYITEAVLLKNPATRAHVYTKAYNKIVMPGGLREQLYNKYLEAPEGVVKQQAASRVNAIDWAIAEFGDPDSPKDLISGKGVMAYNFRKSPFLTIVDKTQVYEELIDTEKDQGYEKQGNTLKLEMMFDPLITSFLKGLYQTDREGNIIINEYGTPKPMNFKFAVNRLSHVLGRGVDLDKAMSILRDKQHTEPVFSQIINKLGPTKTSNDNARNIINLLWQGFNTSQVQLLQLTQNEDQDGTLSTTFGVASSPTDQTYRAWESAFSLTSHDTIKKTPEGASYLDLTAFFEKFPKFQKGKEMEILHALGILITDDVHGTVRKRLGSGDNYFGTSNIYNTLQALHELERPDLYGKDLTKVTPVPIAPITSITQIVGDFTKYAPANVTPAFKKRLVHNSSRISNILQLDAKHNEKVGHTVANAKDDPQQELTVPFFLTIITDTINSVTSWEELMSIPEMDYLSKHKNFPAKFSRILASIFDSKGNRRLSVGGIEIKRKGDKDPKRYVEFKLNNFGGIALTSNSFHITGSAITDLNKLDALMVYLDTFVRSGNMMGPGHGAKSTTVMYHVKTWPIKAGDQLHSGKHYVDIPQFIHPANTRESEGRDQANAILIDYINGELGRIHAFNELPATAPERGVYKTGGEFTTFHDILSPNSKERLINLQKEEIEKDPLFTLEKYFNPANADKYTGNPNELYNQIVGELNIYFEGQISHVADMFSKVKFIDDAMITTIKADSNFSKITWAEENQERIPRALLEAFVYNTWMHSYEGHAIFYGDSAQFEGQTRSKRDGAMGSPGRQADFSESGFTYINNKGKNARPYGHSTWNTRTVNGVVEKSYETYKTPVLGRIVNSAVIQEVVTASSYLEDNIIPTFEEEIKKIRNSKLTEKEKKERLAQTVQAFRSMKIADAAGVVTFDFYRILRIQNGTWWSNPRLETVFQKIINKEEVDFSEVTTIYHTVKLQYSGPLDAGTLPMMANHKFMVVPLIPTTIKGKNWEVFHNQMVNQNVDYALFQSGSKTATITKDGKGVANLFYTDPATKTIAFNSPDYIFTKNPVFLKYLKEQTATSDEYDGQATTSRQLRTLSIGNLMSGDAPIDFMMDATDAERTKAWLKLGPEAKLAASPIFSLIKDYEKNLADKTNFIKARLLTEMGWVEGGDAKVNMKKLLTFVRHELERRDQPEHIIDYIELDEKFNAPLRQFSLSPNAEDIEKILSNLVTKRLVNQKSNGQSYYMVSDVGHEKIGSSESLPFYKRGEVDPATGKRRATSLAGCRIPLHDDFRFLLKMKHRDGKLIGTRERLNVLIRDKQWLAEGDNLKMISLAGIRIPGQGMNSVDALQVYEFLPEESSPIIMMHPEVVAKVGADYDNDKFPSILPNLVVTKEGKVLYAQEGLKGIENRILENIKKFALLEENYAKLVKPNGTFLLKPYTDNELKSYVADVDFEKNNRSENKGFSPTRIMEIDYNLTKLTDIVSAQQALGITMVALRWDPLYNRVGFRFNPSYSVKKKTGVFVFEKAIELYFDHNYYTGDKGERYISLSHTHDVEGELISDSISQTSNGNVDAETDAWAAFMQANKAATPVMMLMFKAGVSRKNIMNFISMPLVRAYYQEQAESRGPNSRKLGKAPRNPQGKLEPNFYKGKALEAILSDPKYGFGMIFTQFNRPNSAPGKLALNNALALLINEMEETPSQITDSQIKFEEEPTTGYKNRTIKNASADATIAIAFGLTPDMLKKSSSELYNLRKRSPNDLSIPSGGEKLTYDSVLGQNKKYIPIDANILTVTKERVDKIVEQLNSINKQGSSVARIPQNLVSGIEAFGTKQEANSESKKILGNSPHSIDMIEAGLRTRTTRSVGETEKYNVKVGDIVTQFGKSANGTTKQILTKITAIHPKGTSGFLGTWSKEGWTQKGISAIERFKDGAAAIEFEIVKPSITLNIAGNGIYTMKGKYTQQQVDNFTYDLLNQVLNSPNLKTKIESIRSGGQTGFDEAGAKAGVKLGIPTTILAPKGWTFRNIEGKDISNEQQFKARFTKSTQPKSVSIKAISPDYGVVKTDTAPSKATTDHYIDLIKPQIANQAYKENSGTYANWMFMYGLRWTRKKKAHAPIKLKSWGAKEGKEFYVYDTLDQAGGVLPPISDLQPIIDEIKIALGVDMSNYDSVIGNIYLPGEHVSTHRDTTEAASARNYPVLVYTIGNNSGITIYENEKEPGKASFASDKARTIPTKNGTIYAFGMEGKGRFEVAHDTPKNIKRDIKFPPITLPNGKTIENYTITLTFRRAQEVDGVSVPVSPVTSNVSAVPTESRQRVVLPIGISGSGKSTWIESLPKGEYTVVSPDKIRKELTGDISNQTKNAEVFAQVDKEINEALSNNKPVILDATNLNTALRRKFTTALKAKFPNVEINYKLFEATAALAKGRIKADIIAKKDRSNVPEEIIDKQIAMYTQTLEDIKSEPISEFGSTVLEPRDEFRFTTEKLHDNIVKASGKTIGKDYIPNDYDKAAFLHFIEVEEMAKASRDITMNLTGDTKRSKSLASVWNRKTLIQGLSNNGMFDYRLITKLLNESPIASFDTNDFVMRLLGPLFTLRDHPTMLEFVGKKQKAEVFNDVPATTGDVDTYGSSLINDFIGGYLFQNMLRGFDINKVTTYKGFGVNKNVTVKDIKSLKHGVDVVNDVLYVDKAQLKQDFDYKLFSKPVYKTRGLATIPVAAFPTEDEYYHFVFEREYLRSITLDKAKELANTPEEYEKFLAAEALDNTFNMWKLFNSTSSFAAQFQKIKDDADTKHLLDEYSVLSALIVDVEKDRENKIVPGGFKNIRPLIRTSDLTKDEVDIYHEELLRLANSSTIKSNNAKKNATLTRFFKKLPFVAMLQSGMNTSNQFSFVKIVPQNEINAFMEHKADEWITLLDAIRDGRKPTTEIELYYKKWYDANAYTNKSRFRLKDFLVSQQDRAVAPPERLPDLFIPLKFAVEQTNLSLTAAEIKKIAESNPNKLFIWGAGTDMESSIYTSKVKKDAYLKDYNNSYPIRIRKRNSIGQNPVFHLTDGTKENDFAEYKENIKMIEEDIANLNAKRDSGITLVFNSSGYGQALIGADDITGDNIDTDRAFASRTFAYLSRRLYEEFNYVNRNFLSPALYLEKVIDPNAEIADQDLVKEANDLLIEKNEKRIIMSETNPNFVAARNLIQKAQPSSDESVRYRISTCFSTT